MKNNILTVEELRKKLEDIPGNTRVYVNADKSVAPVKDIDYVDVLGMVVMFIE